MPAVCVVMPILRGKEDAARRFAEEVRGPRAAEFAQWQRAGGNTTRETWHLQQSPDGFSLAVWFEVDDPEGAFKHLARAGGFGAWFRDRVREVTGVDVSDADAMPPPELLLDWRA